MVSACKFNFIGTFIVQELGELGSGLWIRTDDWAEDAVELLDQVFDVVTLDRESLTGMCIEYGEVDALLGAPFADLRELIEQSTELDEGVDLPAHVRVEEQPVDGLGHLIHLGRDPDEIFFRVLVGRLSIGDHGDALPWRRGDGSRH
jgi:hypothetical protein